MVKWKAYHQGKEFLLDCEVDFVEESQITGIAPSKISKGDEVEIDWPDGRGDKGIVTKVENNVMHLIVNEQEYRLRPATDTDNVNPIKSEMKVDPWIVIE